MRWLPNKVSLPWVLVVPFVAQLLGVVGIVGYLSLRNGEVAIENLANRLMREVCVRTALNLRHYFAQPHLVNQITVNAIETGQLDLDDLESVEATLFNRIREFDDISGVLVGTEAQDVRIATRRSKLRILATDPSYPGQVLDYAASEDGQRLNLIQTIAKPDVQNMSWYAAAAQTDSPVWVPVFQTGDNQNLSLNASQAIHDPISGELIGVASSGIVLSVIDAFLDEFRISPNGVVFVVERNGLLIGSSTQDPIYDRQRYQGKEVLHRIAAQNSQDSLLKATADFVASSIQQQTPLSSKNFNFDYAGEKLFVEVAPFKDRYGLDLFIVVAVPERDFMAQIQANTRNTILLCIVATGVAITMGLITSRWIARPILQLSGASHKISAGQFQRPLPPACIKEVNVLVNSFNQMSHKVQDYSTSLEEKVQERTAALEQEICDRKQIEAQLEQAKSVAESANRAKSAFLASMSHELRTPLNAILGFTQLMGYKKIVHEEHHDYLNIINQSGQHLLDLINDVLDMSKIEANQVDLDYTHVNLPQLLKTLEDIFSLKAEAKQLRLKSAIHPQVPTHLYTDEGKLRQILMNLLSNAIKFTQAGDITLAINPTGNGLSTNSAPTCTTTDAKTQSLRFTVTDTGTGISPDEIVDIFDPFVQTKDGQRIPGGTGLGLAISQQYARLLGGEITVLSTPGEGSAFSLTLSAGTTSSPKPNPNPWQTTVHRLQQQSNPYRLLIAEDQYENRYLLQQCLKFSNLDIRLADNGETCFEIWQNWSPHIILMDLAMPVMDGYETTRRIKTTAQGKETIIIAVTSYAFEENRRRAIEAGCDSFIRKPIEISELLSQLARYLEITPENSPTITNYPASGTASNTTREHTTAKPSGHSDGKHLARMPMTWIQQLQQVAYQCNDQQVMALLHEIPPTEVLLKQTLEELAKAYHFREIVTLTETALAHRSKAPQAS